MNTIEHAVARPFPEIIIDRAMWRKILWQLPPLATRAIDIANCVEHLAHVCVALASARASRRDHRFYDGPLLVGDVTRVTPTSRRVRLALEAKQINGQHAEHRGIKGDPEPEIRVHRMGIRSVSCCCVFQVARGSLSAASKQR